MRIRLLFGIAVFVLIAAIGPSTVLPARIAGTLHDNTELLNIAFATLG
jgi:hypothetical protein